MPIGTITNGEAGSSVRTKLNSVIGEVNDLPTNYATFAQGATADTALQPAEVKSTDFTAANEGLYTVVASATITDPSPTEGKGYTVVVRNGTATIGGTGYSTAGSQIRRIFHSGAWATYVDVLTGDSRLSDARTPTSHASSHLTGGADAIQPATASVPGLMTAAYAAKLDAISGTNTGDNAANSLYSGLVSNATHTGDVTGATVLTIANDAVTNAKLANMTENTIKARKTAGTGDPEDCTLSELIDAYLGGSVAHGDIIYRGASGWARLPAGTSGEYLKTLGAGANPDWDTPSGGGGGGKILQVVQATETATVSVSGSTYGTILSATITPSSSSSRILVMACLNVSSSSSGNLLRLKLLRASTDLLNGDSASSRSLVLTGGYVTAADLAYAFMQRNINYVDSPATTSATTYNIQMSSSGGGDITYLNRSSGDADASYVGRGASTIILMEIGP